jgi:hypothetical protein
MHRFIPFVSLLAVIAGCGSGDPTPLPPNDTAAAAAAIFAKVPPAYMQAYQAMKKPPTPDDLKPFLKQHGDTIASLVSPRDGKPIVLVPFVPDSKLEPGEQAILAYEAEGVNGERMVVDSRGMIRKVNAEEFATIKFAGGYKPK